MVTPRDRTNERHWQKREGALEDKEKSDVGEGRWARRWRTAPASLSVTIGQTPKDVAASVNACVRDTQIVPMSNVFDSFLQNNMTSWVTFQKYMSWFSLFHCLRAWHYAVLCCLLLRVTLQVSASASVFYFMHITLSVVTIRGCVRSPSCLSFTSSLASSNGTQIRWVYKLCIQTVVFSNETNHVNVSLR